MEPVSVVIPTYNRAALLPAAIDSVLRAVDDGDEIIVADDGSTDSTACAVRRFAPRVRHLALPHRGAGAARNAGIAASAHDLVAFADSDDEWLPNRLRWQRPLLSAESGLVFAFSDFGQLYPDGRREMSYVRRWSGDQRGWDAILGPARRLAEFLAAPTAGEGGVAVHVGSLYGAELQANYVNVNTVLVRRSAAGDSLRFADDLPTFEDWDCFARLSRRGPCAYVDGPTALQRTHDGPRLTDSSLAVRLQARLTVIERNWGSDPDFLGRNGRSVARTVYRLRRSLARYWLLAGHRAEARRILAQLDGVALERLAARLPPSLLRLAGPAIRGWRHLAAP